MEESEKKKEQDSAYSKEVLELFPERSGEAYKPRWYKIALFGENPFFQKWKCEESIIHCIEKYPLVKLMVRALHNKGCEIDLRRNFACEYCGKGVTGGFDVKKNQIVICYNRIYQYGVLQGVMAHELLHMFDSCRAKLNFENDEHVACTEIRAANLMHCSVMSGFFQGTVNPLNITKAHQDCVKLKAAVSLKSVRPNFTTEKAMEIVERVFPKCYNDLEPVGRRIRRNSNDMEWAYRERHLYGYY